MATANADKPKGFYCAPFGHRSSCGTKVTVGRVWARTKRSCSAGVSTMRNRFAELLRDLDSPSKSDQGASKAWSSLPIFGWPKSSWLKEILSELGDDEYYVDASEEVRKCIY